MRENFLSINTWTIKIHFFINKITSLLFLIMSLIYINISFGPGWVFVICALVDIWNTEIFNDYYFLQVATQNQYGIGLGIKREVFFLNLEDGYFGCQVNESTQILQLYELSKLCDGVSDCYKASDELRAELKCTGKYFLL